MFGCAPLTSSTRLSSWASAQTSRERGANGTTTTSDSASHNHHVDGNHDPIDYSDHVNDDVVNDGHVNDDFVNDDDNDDNFDDDSNKHHHNFIHNHNYHNHYHKHNYIEYDNRDWTNGCIAVKNQEMDEIWTAVRDGTPIRILP
jgi:hypothetical protein